MKIENLVIGVLILLVVCGSAYSIEPIESQPKATPTAIPTPMPTVTPTVTPTNEEPRWYWKEVTITIYPRILTHSGLDCLSEDEMDRVIREVDAFSEILNSYGILVNVGINNNTLPGAIIGSDGWLWLNQLSRDSKGDDIIIWNDGGVHVAYAGTASYIRRTGTAYCTIPVCCVSKEILVHEWLHIVDWNHRYSDNHYDPDQCELYGFSRHPTDGWMPCYIWMMDQYFSDKAEEYGWR